MYYFAETIKIYLKDIINQKFYIYVYTTTPSCYEQLLIPENKCSLHYVGLSFHAGYIGHSARAPNHIT